MTVNGLTDLRPRTMERALLDYPIPISFANDVLQRTSFAVLEVTERSGRSRPPLYAVPSERVDRSADTEPTLILPGQPALDLTMDAGLRRLWRRHTDQELLGIAGAKVGSSTTVLAVPVGKPGESEESRLREAFSRHYDDRQLRLVSASAATYDGIVREWFLEVEGWPRRVLTVTETADDAALQVRIDPGRSSLEERRDGLQVGEDSDREALQRLLPYERVEFVAADAD